MKPAAYSHLLPCLGCALASAVLAGCGDGGVKTVNVSGTVYLDNEPVEGLEVHFVGPSHGGYAVTAADGSYQLVQGAEPGENKLYFRKVEGPQFSLDPELGMDMGQLEAMAMADGGSANVVIPGQIIPAKYSDPTRSNIAFNVPESGTDNADFRLTSK